MLVSSPWLLPLANTTTLASTMQVASSCRCSCPCRGSCRWRAPWRWRAPCRWRARLGAQFKANARVLAETRADGEHHGAGEPCPCRGSCRWRASQHWQARCRWRARTEACFGVDASVHAEARADGELHGASAPQADGVRLSMYGRCRCSYPCLGSWTGAAARSRPVESRLSPRCSRALRLADGPSSTYIAQRIAELFRNNCSPRAAR